MDEFLRELAQIDRMADYSKTMALLRALKSGVVTLDHLQLVGGNNWQLTTVVPGQPATPAAVESVPPGNG